MICRANQLIGFYMLASLMFNELDYYSYLQLAVFAAIQIVGQIVQMHESFNILVAFTYFSFFLLVVVFSNYIF